MSAGMVEPTDGPDAIDPVAAWDAIRARLRETLADLSDEERQALADEISDEIDRNITERLRRGSTT